MKENKTDSLFNVFCTLNNLDKASSLKMLPIYLKACKELNADDSFEGLSMKNEILNFIFGELNSPVSSLNEDEIVESVILKYKSIFVKHKLDAEGIYMPISNNLKVTNNFFIDLNSPHCKTDPRYSLINDLYNTIFKKIDAFSTMIAIKMYTEAFVSWRTIHESECIIKLLTTGGIEIQDAYIKHIAYNNAYRNPESFTVEENDLTFEKLKSEMKSHNLKSKDMKKFIEYGWIYKYKTNEEIKLNFRDGVEKLANLRKYNQIYEGASELVHSSSTFFYVNDDFCRDLALSMTYKTALRVYQSFHDYFKNYFNKKEVEDKYLYFIKLLNDTITFINKDFDEESIYDDSQIETYENYKKSYDS